MSCEVGAGALYGAVHAGGCDGLLQDFGTVRARAVRNAGAVRAVRVRIGRVSDTQTAGRGPRVHGAEGERQTGGAYSCGGSVL